jgi:hypothetical protein
MDATEIRERWNGGLSAATPIASALIDQARDDTGVLLDEIDRLQSLVRMSNDRLASTFAPLSAWGGVFDTPDMLATFDRALGLVRHASVLEEWDYEPADPSVGIRHETWTHEDCPTPSPAGTTPASETTDEDGNSIVRCPDCGAFLLLGVTM